MKITKVEIIPVSIMPKRTFVMASVTFSGDAHVHYTLVKLHTDEGIIGLGETARPTPSHSGETPSLVMAVLKDVLAPVVLGQDPFTIDQIIHRMDTALVGNYLSKAAIDYALHDLVGKALGVPVYKLIGGRCRDSVRLGWMISLAEPEVMADEAVRALEAGYGNHLRMKMGSGIKKDVARIKVIREAVGDDVQISADVNRAYTPEPAINAIRRMDEYDLTHVEQPVAGSDLFGMARVRQAVDVPIYADDSAWSVEGCINCIRAGAADGFLLKPTRAGGIYKSQRYVAIADAAGLSCIEASQFGGPIEMAALAHIGVSQTRLGDYPNIPLGYIITNGGFDTAHITEDMTFEIPRVERGHLYPHEGPGLGVTLNEDFINRHLSTNRAPVTVTLDDIGGAVAVPRKVAAPA